MRLATFRARLTLVVLALVGVAAAPVAADPLFGPATFERTAGGTDIFSETFEAPAPGPAYVWVVNGDESGSRVTSGSIEVNGRMVANEADFSRRVTHFARPATLLAGSNTITVALNGQPGSFITVSIGRPPEPPDLTTGRLVIPYATTSNLVIDLKNGSHRSDRKVRIVFYDAFGTPVARSERLMLGPRASFSLPVINLIANGAWSEGSIEVFYAGDGPGRVFGQAVVQESTTSVASVVPLQEAGHRRLDPFRLTPD